jgi:hypothetical protein
MMKRRGEEKKRREKQNGCVKITNKNSRPGERKPKT